MKPLAYDLFAGLFGWGAGFVAEGWRVIGFDLESRAPAPEGCEMRLRDILTNSRLRTCGCFLHRGLSTVPGIQLHGAALEAC